MDAALLSETSAVHGLFSQAEVDRLLQEHLEGRQDHERILWSLISLEVFLRAFELKNMGRGLLPRATPYPALRIVLDGEDLRIVGGRRRVSSALSALPWLQPRAKMLDHSFVPFRSPWPFVWAVVLLSSAN